MNIVITGASNGSIGNEIVKLLEDDHDIWTLPRDAWDMDYPGEIMSFDLPNNVDILINCAGHDIGGKVSFTDHKFEHWIRVMNTNLVSTIALTHRVLQANPSAIIVNITSTNVDRYYPNDLIYSLTKNALKDFTEMLRIEYPKNTNQFREVRLGLTKTKFVDNRHKENHIPKIDLYAHHEHLTAKQAAKEIVNFLNKDQNFIRIVV